MRAESRVKLVLSQPPIHWTTETQGFAYLTTALGLGYDAASTLPLEALFGAAPRGEWGRGLHLVSSLASGLAVTIVTLAVWDVSNLAQRFIVLLMSDLRDLPLRKSQRARCFGTAT
jgi:hypothetical protein